MTAPDTTPAAVAEAVARWRDHARVYGERHAPPDGGHGAAMLGEAADLIDVLAAERDALAAALAACERERDAARAEALAEVDAAIRSVGNRHGYSVSFFAPSGYPLEGWTCERVPFSGDCDGIDGHTPTAALFAAAAALPPAAPDPKE